MTGTQIFVDFFKVIKRVYKLFWAFLQTEMTYRKIPKISPSKYKPSKIVTQKTLH